MNTIGSINLTNINYYFLFGCLFLIYLVYRIFYSLFDNNFIRTKYRVCTHAWRSIECNKSIPYNIHVLLCGDSCLTRNQNNYFAIIYLVLSADYSKCTVCGKLMLPVMGFFCECCAVSACKKCHSILDKNVRCKQITWPSGKPFYHLWVNVGTATRANVHSEDGENLYKYFCSWCQRIQLTQDNLINYTEECDFLKYREIIIPPSSVLVERGKIISIKPPHVNNWEPLLILVNRKAGSSRGDEILSIFRGLLNPLQVIDISSNGPERIVKWLPEKCRVLVAGGDGTVAWVLNALHSAPHVKASVGILPMGTGNDLSRALGWGAGSSSLDAHSIIHSIKHAELQILDRWRVTIKPKRRRLGRLRTRVLHAYNYASVGVDAQVALDFDRARNQFLYRYASRYLNYMAYALLGVGRALDDGGCGGLEQRLRVTVGVGNNVDGGETLPLPPLQALVVLNIPSWGAGVDLWSLGSEDDVGEQHMDDGKLEVVGISSSFHIARLQCGLAEPYRFAQGTRVKIELDGCCAMQVDGEPWMQDSATILVEPAGQSTMLRPIQKN